jgi:PAS domain S-box-containing protein
MPVSSTALANGLSDSSIPKTQFKVMVVEDEAIIALDIQKQLIQAGFMVTGDAQTALEAFHLIERQSPDLVLMDIRLKGDMDGVGAASAIRSRYGLPVIYLTAHADDATLERASETEPYGFLVKPFVGATNLKAAITMAVYKHQMQNQLRMNRRLLSAILQSLDDPIIVADPTDEVLFLNRAAEQITGWSLKEAFGKGLSQIAAIQDDHGCELSSFLLRQVVATGAPMRIPRNSVLIMKDGHRIDVSGQLSVMAVDRQRTAVFVSLQDPAVQRREWQVSNQERAIRTFSQFAQGVGCAFDGVFEMVDQALSGLAKSQTNEKLDLIRRASQVGTDLSAQLLEIGEGYGSAHVVNVEQYLLSSQTLLKRLCGTEIQFELSSSADLGYVLSTGNHFEQMLVNLIREGGQQLEGQGSLLLGADVQRHTDSLGRTGSYIRLYLTIKTIPAKDPVPEESSSFLSESPQLGLAILRVIAEASDGFVLSTRPIEGSSMIEVFLPRHASRISATNATNEPPKVILLIGLESDLAESLRRGLVEDVLFLEAASPDEAACISEIYEGDIDLIILDDDRFATETAERARRRIGARRPGIFFMQTSNGTGGIGIDPVGLEQRIKNLFYGKAQSAVSPNDLTKDY